jgi:hypothetical protein
MATVTVLAALAVVLHFVIAIVLVRKCVRTRDVGFVWLGAAVVIWPLVSRLLELGERSLIDRLAQHRVVGFYPFSLVEHGQMTLGGLVAPLSWFQQLIGICLLLVAVLYLSKTKNTTDLRAAG